jgi:FMN phosphatase YigB (HAD superfamily)
MATLQEYIESIEKRKLIWPQPPPLEPVKATPYIKPISGIRAVTWSVYGTLLRISEGRLLFDSANPLPMQVALDKTIHEFNLWHSMSRKSGPPWEQLYSEYKHFLDEQLMAGCKIKGDFPQVDSACIWSSLIARLQKKEYEYDVSYYGNVEEFSQKMAYFFHANLQGIEASPHALQALQSVGRSPVKQGLLADAQPFTFPQMLRAIGKQSTLPALESLFSMDHVTLSFQEKVRKPSISLYRKCLMRFQELGIAPQEILHISTRLKDDLVAAKQQGMRTALYAADKLRMQDEKKDIRDPELRPDRLMTDLLQIRDILPIE